MTKRVTKNLKHPRARLQRRFQGHPVASLRWGVALSGAHETQVLSHLASGARAPGAPRAGSGRVLADDPGVLRGAPELGPRHGSDRALLPRSGPGAGEGYPGGRGIVSRDLRRAPLILGGARSPG